MKQTGSRPCSSVKYEGFHKTLELITKTVKNYLYHSVTVLKTCRGSIWVFCKSLVFLKPNGVAHLSTAKICELLTGLWQKEFSNSFCLQKNWVKVALFVFLHVFVIEKFCELEKLQNLIKLFFVQQYQKLFKGKPSMILKVIVIKKLSAFELYLDFSSKFFSSDTRRELLVFMSFSCARHRLHFSSRRVCRVGGVGGPYVLEETIANRFYPEPTRNLNTNGELSGDVMLNSGWLRMRVLQYSILIDFLQRFAKTTAVYWDGL